MRFLPFGMTLTGLALTLISIGITAISNSPLTSKYIGSARIGSFGVPLGEETGIHLAALDERIDVTVVSQWF